MRFETDERFWEIEREGTRVRVRTGRLGEHGDQITHLAHFEAEARREFDERIAKKLEQGYQPVRAAAEPIARVDPGLAAAVLDALAGEREPGLLRSAWWVLGDWLADLGDVRGELIAIDEALASASETDRPALLARQERLLAEWIPRWFGELGVLVGRGQPIELEWDHGFIAGARIGADPQRLDLSGYRLDLRDLVPALARLVAHPLFSFLRRLRIAELDPHGRRDLGKALAELASAPRPALTRLELGGLSRAEWIRDELGTPRQRIVLARIGSLAPLSAADRFAPRLTELSVSGRELLELPTIPQLEALELTVHNFAVDLRTWLVSHEWPHLRRLWLHAIKFNDAWAHAPDDHGLDALLDRLSDSPLCELGLQGPTALAIYLDRADWAARGLRELRLTNLGDAGVDLLLAQPERLDRVEKIVLQGDEFGRRRAELARRFGGRLGRSAAG